MHPPTAALIEAGLRGGFVALMLLLAWRLLRGPRVPAAGLGVLMCLGSAAYALQSTQAAQVAAGQLPGWQWPLQALMNGNPVVMWLLACALFDDAFRLRRWHAALWLVWVGMSLGNCTRWHHPALALLAGAGPILFAVAALWPMLRSWQGDLVEARIRWRVRILAVVLGYSVLSAVAGIPSPASASSTWVGLVDALALCAVAAFVASALLGLAPGLWLLVPAAPALAQGPVAAPQPGRRVGLGEPGAAAGVASAAAADDPGALSRLQRAMQQEQIFRREGLTIGALAAHLGLPEYRLRRVINGQLGQRNFNAYLNAHRIAWAREALADPAQAEVPVLSLATAAGFQSLGPFNRAFKADTGLTPTEFRAQALAERR
ncbi:AraC family transcriptional regulator [Ideonella sp. DXS22W]|uniref:AraC family transcriptional regulator n=1 Tax=Pseudaquabacterium inlustre TaxID=2984192 RepID=A0ABU9CKQ1_9BURK